MSTLKKTKIMLTDSHFMIPVVVLCFGLALLIVLH
jgi:hypothetical protein